MTHEFIHIIEQAKSNQRNGIKNVLATVVDLDGSSYRKPGVRMLLSENGKMNGAVSGGCVEKEVFNRAQEVFKTDIGTIMTYDGRYRLGCEGILYILLEPFYISDEFYSQFSKNSELRNSFKIISSYKKEDGVTGNLGSEIFFEDGNQFKFSDFETDSNNSESLIFEQILKPAFKLSIIGGEHDAVKLCAMASLLGWEVHVVTSIKDPKTILDFPGAKKVTSHTPESFPTNEIDEETAVVFMNHNYALDLKYVLKFQNLNFSYLGILGSAKRREKLLSDLIEYAPNVSEKFLENIHSPAGLNIGAITPEEIALSILSEILTVTRDKKPVSLKSFSGKIHS